MICPGGRNCPKFVHTLPFKCAMVSDFKTDLGKFS